MIRFLALLLFMCPAFAAPPADVNADLPIARWFKDLKQPGTDYGCCSIADCRPVAYRTIGRRYQAFIDQKTFGPRAPDLWMDVPSAAVLHRHDNPVGEAVACLYEGAIICFVEAPGA